MLNIIGIQYDEIQAAELQRDLADIPHGIDRVLTRAVNKVGVAARTKIVRRVAENINITQAEIRRRNIDLKKATWEYPTANIYITGRRIPLASFRARQTRRGVSYSIRRGGRSVLSHSFLADMPNAVANSHRGVFLRRRKSRLPIDEKFGPSVPQVVQDLPEMASGIFEDEIDNQLEREVHTQVGLVIERYRK